MARVLCILLLVVAASSLAAQKSVVIKAHRLKPTKSILSGLRACYVPWMQSSPA